MKSRTLVLTLAAVALLVMSAVPLAADPGRPVTCQIDWVFDGVIYEGPVTDCPYEGWGESFVISGEFPGPTPEVPFSSNTEHWIGATIIYPNTGGAIVSFDRGVWNLNHRADGVCSFEECLKYRTNGEVVSELTVGEDTYSTTDYDELIGSKTHGMGYTSEFPPPGAFFGAEQEFRIK